MKGSTNADAVVTHRRIVITGIPKSGKTNFAGTLHEETSYAVLASDALIGWLPWSDLSRFVSERWNDLGAAWIMEGVATVRALRKWLAANEGKPCDIVYFLADPAPGQELTNRQAGMGKGCRTIFEEIVAELVKRDVEVRELSSEDFEDTDP